MKCVASKRISGDVRVQLIDATSPESAAVEFGRQIVSSILQRERMMDGSVVTVGSPEGVEEYVLTITFQVVAERKS